MKTASCILIKEQTFVICSVDDLTIFPDTELMVDGLKTELAREFKVKDIGKAVQLLGTGLGLSSGWCMRVRQTILIEKPLFTTGMSKCKPVGSPVISHLSYGSYQKSSALSSVEHKLYPYFIRSSWCLAMKMKQDWSVAARMLASNVKIPTQLQMSASKWVFHYLREPWIMWEWCVQARTIR